MRKRRKSRPQTASPVELHHDRSEFNVLFVHSALDDLGLSAAEFRMYGHLARRAGQGVAWPAIASMAEVCRLHATTVRRVLRSLTEQHLITRESRPGDTDLYRLTAPSQWQPRTVVSPDPCESDAPPSDENHPPLQQMQDAPSTFDAGEGYPMKGESKEGSPSPHSPPE